MRGSALPLLLALASCGAEPASAPCRLLQVRSEKLSPSAGPPPHYGWSISGAVVLKDAPQAKAISDRSLPRRLSTKDAKADFLATRSRVRIVDGVFYFVGFIDEKAWWQFGLSGKNETFHIEFENPEGGIWSAHGTMEILNAGQPRHEELERALKN